MKVEELKMHCSGEGKYRELFELGSDGLIIHDLNGKMLDVNRIICDRLGYSREELLLMTQVEIEAPECAELVPERIFQIFADMLHVFETCHVARDGSRIPTEVCCRLIDYDGQQAVLSAARDITERKLIEIRLSESEARYRRITEGLTDYQYTVRVENGSAIDTKMSPACATVTGYMPEDFAVDPFLWITMVVPEDRELVRGQVEKILAGEDILPIEHRIIHKNGELRWISDTTILFKNESGQLLAYDGVIKDITERKQYEHLLEDKNAELERFTYTVSHDLKSPLITIQGYASVIRSDIEKGNYLRAVEDLRRIDGAAAKMTALLNDLLNLSRIGRQINVIALIDMNRLVNDALMQLEGVMAHTQAEVVVQPHLPSVLGDPVRIAEVVQNLIENAVKYSGNIGTARIEVGARQEGKDCVFFVRDNGIGIDPRYHKSIFGLFNKLDAKSEGTGVGLALVKRIIEVHGGRVWVESEGPGTGSKFCFILQGTDEGKLISGRQIS